MGLDTKNSEVEEKDEFVFKQFKLVERTLNQWVREFCADGDTLQVHKLDTGAVAVQNTRTKVTYIVSDS